LFAAFTAESNAQTILYLLSLDHYRQALITELATVQNSSAGLTPFITTITSGHEQNIQAVLDSSYARELLELSIANDPQSADVDTAGRVAERMLAYYKTTGDEQAIQKYQRILSLFGSKISTLNATALAAVARPLNEDFTPATLDEKKQAIQARLYNLVLDGDAENVGAFLQRDGAVSYINAPILEAAMQDQSLKGLFFTFINSGLEKDSLRNLLTMANTISNGELSSKINGLLNVNNFVSTSKLATIQYAAPVAIAPSANSTFSMTPAQAADATSEFSFAPRNLYAVVAALPNTNNNGLPGSGAEKDEGEKKEHRLEHA
jgi:hypothetical protein